MSQQAISLWRSQLPSYSKILARCCLHITTPMTSFLPSDFEQKKEQLRTVLEMKQSQSSPELYLPYLGVITHFIEGKKNKSVIEMADMLVQEFGGSIRYWQNILMDVAEQVSYTTDLTLWHIRKLFQENLYTDPESLSNYRRLCKLAKAYLSSLATLIKGITKFDTKKDSISKIDELFKKLKVSQQKYVGFCQQINYIQQSSTFDELSNNISQKSKQNALNKLFHFRETGKEKSEKSKNHTLLKYNFKAANQSRERVSEPTKNTKETGKHLTGQKLLWFENTLKTMKTPQISIQDLQKQFISSNCSELGPLVVPRYVSIWDKDYYFSYLSHPMDPAALFASYTQPFAKHDYINYEIASDEEYQDLLGEDVENNEEMSEVSSFSRNSFVVSDDHLSEDENVDGINKDGKPVLTAGFGDRWDFQRGSQTQHSKSYIMLPIDNKIPFEVSQKNQIQEILCRVVNNKTKQTIIEALSKQRIKVSKAKLKEFLQKKCRQVLTESKKTIYKVMELQEQKQWQKQLQEAQYLQIKEEQTPQSMILIPSLAEENKSEDSDDENTWMNEQEYFSQVGSQRMGTRASKRQHSEKLRNQGKANGRGNSENMSEVGVVTGLRSRASGKEKKSV